MNKIRGLVALGNGKSRWEDLILSEPESGELVIEIEAASICHTDISYMNGNFADRFPTVLGHEAVGKIVKKGKETTRNIGERVGITFALCGECKNCKLSKVAYCEKAFAVNFLEDIRKDKPVIFRVDGTPVNQFFGQSSLATASLVKEHSVFSVPESVELAQLAPIGCSVQTGAGSVMHDVIPPFIGLGMVDLTVVIGGCGGVGLSAISAAHSLGVGKIIAIDPNELTHALAKKMGAHFVFTPNSPELEANIFGTADYYLEASGQLSSIELAFKLIKVTKGTLIIVGSPKLGTVAKFDVVSMIAGRTIKGVTEGSGSPEFCSRLVGEIEAGTYSVKPMLTTLPFEEEEITKFINTDSKNVIKPVFIKN